MISSKQQFYFRANRFNSWGAGCTSPTVSASLCLNQLQTQEKLAALTVALIDLFPSTKNMSWKNKNIIQKHYQTQIAHQHLAVVQPLLRCPCPCQCALPPQPEAALHHAHLWNGDDLGLVNWIHRCWWWFAVTYGNAMQHVYLNRGKLGFGEWTCKKSKYCMTC